MNKVRPRVKPTRRPDGLLMRLPDIDLRLFVPKPPFWLVAVILVSLVGSWIPLALIARYRVTKHDKPRIHMFLDMDKQAKLTTQTGSPVFADGRAMRRPVPGTVAVGHLEADDAFYRGFTGAGDQTVYTTGYPDRPGLTIDADFLKTGQARFNVYCAPCHGASGNGQGAVQQRAMALMSRQGNPSGTTWVQPADLHASNPETGVLTYGAPGYPNGQLFNTIALGKGNMAGYAAQITPEDRWAIVAYVRALQLSQHTPADDLTPAQRAALAADTPPND